MFRSRPSLLLLALASVACGGENIGNVASSGPSEAESGEGTTSDSAAGTGSSGGSWSQTAADSWTAGGVGTSSTAGGITSGIVTGEITEGVTGDSTVDSDTSGSSNGATGDDSGSGDDAGAEVGELAGGDEDDPNIVGLRISPKNMVFDLGLSATHVEELKVFAVQGDGGEYEVTQGVVWSVDLTATTVTDGKLELQAADRFEVRHGFIEASMQGVDAGRAQVTVISHARRDDDAEALFVVPRGRDRGGVEAPLTLVPKLARMDVFVAMDKTGSMEGEINNLQSQLTNTIIPDIKAAIEDSEFGVGSFADFPVANFGSAALGDQPFTLIEPVGAPIADIIDGILGLRATGGSDFPESMIEALHQIATGEGLSGPGATLVAANDDGIGGVAFREGSLPVIVPITDAVSHSPGEVRCVDELKPVAYDDEVDAVAATREQVESELTDLCAKVVTISSGAEPDLADQTCTPRYDGEAFAEVTGALVLPEIWADDRPSGCASDACCTGIGGRGRATDADGACPLVYDIAEDGSGLAEAMTSSVLAVARYTPFDLEAKVEGQTQSDSGQGLPGGRDSSDFVASLAFSGHGDLPVPGLTPPELSDDRALSTIPGTPLHLKVTAGNDFATQSDRPLVYRANLRAAALGCSLADFAGGELIFVVPPAPLR